MKPDVYDAVTVGIIRDTSYGHGVKDGTRALLKDTKAHCRREHDRHVALVKEARMAGNNEYAAEHEGWALAYSEVISRCNECLEKLGDGCGGENDAHATKHRGGDGHDGR